MHNIPWLHLNLMSLLKYDPKIPRRLVFCGGVLSNPLYRLRIVTWSVPCAPCCLTSTLLFLLLEPPSVPTCGLMYETARLICWCLDSAGDAWRWKVSLVGKTGKIRGRNKSERCARAQPSSIDSSHDYVAWILRVVVRSVRPTATLCLLEEAQRLRRPDDQQQPLVGAIGL